MERDLLDEASDFFCEDLSSVRVCVDSAPIRLGALALARGDTIHVAPPAARLSTYRRNELLGHELAHVVQQRGGRAVPCTTVGGIPLCNDPSLEEEANDLGRRFARYLESPSSERRSIVPVRRRAAALHRGDVVQRLVMLGAQPLSNISGLSEQGSLVLSLIQDGAAWLQWAIGDARSRYTFQDEAALLSSVQVGLHATPLIPLRRAKLLVGAAKLLSLNPDAVKTLATHEGTASNEGVQEIHKILADNDLKPQESLSIAQSFLKETGVADAPIFQGMPLDGRSPCMTSCVRPRISTP